MNKYQFTKTIFGQLEFLEVFHQNSFSNPT